MKRLALMVALALMACGESAAASPTPTPPALATPAPPAPEETTPSRPTGAQATPTRTDDEAAPPLAPLAGSIRVVGLPDGEELLGSEQRLLARFTRDIGRGHDASLAEPSADEVEAATAWLDERATPTPSAWRQIEVVVLLRFAPPRELRRGRRASAGLRDLVVLRPGSSEASYRERTQLAPPERRGPVALDARELGRVIHDLLGDLMGGQR